MERKSKIEREYFDGAIKLIWLLLPLVNALSLFIAIELIYDYKFELPLRFTRLSGKMRIRLFNKNVSINILSIVNINIFSWTEINKSQKKYHKP